MLDSKDLMSLLEDFYTLTGMRIVMFDDKRNELCSFPTGEDTLCSCLRKNNRFNEKCNVSDNRAFDAVKKSGCVEVYTCHAGLVEATVPIIKNHRIVGYLMFGQITSEKDRDIFVSQINALCAEYGICDIPEIKIQKVKYKKEKQIFAAAKILEAISGYVILRDMIKYPKSIEDEIEKYISQNLSKELTPETICKHFGISRTSLYQIMAPFCGRGISNYVKQKRLSYAKELIETTDLSINDIAEKSGFSDTNYFLRCFKKQFGVSARYFKK